MQFQIIKNIINNNLFKRSSIYFIFNGLNAAIPFLLLPILTKYLSPAEYGTAALYRTSIDFIVPIIGFNMGANIDRIFYRVEKKQLSIIIYNMLVILSVTFLLSFLILIFITVIDTNIIGFPTVWVFTLPFAALGFILMNNFNLVILRDSNKPLEYGIWQILFTSVNLGMSLIFIIIFNLGWEGRAGGILVAFFFIGLLGIYNVYRKGFITFELEKDVIKETIKIILPLISHSIGVVILFQSSRYFINNIIGKEAVGLFAIAFSFASIVGLIQDAAVKSINPWMYENLSNITEYTMVKIVKLSYIFFLFMIIVSLIITGISNILIGFLTTAEYEGAKRYVFLLAFGYGFNGMYKIVSSYFIFAGKTALLAVIIFISSIINLILNYFLINSYGTVGAGYAFLISTIFCFILTWYYSNRVFPMPWFNISR